MNSKLVWILMLTIFRTSSKVKVGRLKTWFSEFRIGWLLYNILFSLSWHDVILSHIMTSCHLMPWSMRQEHWQRGNKAGGCVNAPAFCFLICCECIMNLFIHCWCIHLVSSIQLHFILRVSVNAGSNGPKHNGNTGPSIYFLNAYEVTLIGSGGSSGPGFDRTHFYMYRYPYINYH